MKKIIIKSTIITSTIIIIICIISFSYKQENNNKQETNQTNTKITESKFIYGKNNKKTETQETKKEYETMPSNIKGHKVIGKLEIPSIKLNTYILEETNNETLNISVTKLTGPEINEIGNFCITGHNYINNRMFFKLKNVKKEDEIILTNTYGESIKYKVYEIKEIYPNETEVLNQNTKEEKEVTLITCTFGAIKRIIVKASEIYD